MIRTCLHCNSFFTDEENCKDKTCSQHFGDLVLIPDGKVASKETVESARIKVRLLNSNNPKQKFEYVFNCCWKDLDSEGCKKYKHFAGRPDEKDELSEEKLSTS